MNYIFTNNGFTVYFDGTSYQVNKEHINYVALKEAVRDKDSKKFLQLYLEKDAVAVAVRKTNDSRATYVDGVVYLNGQPIHNSLAKRIVEQAKEGHDCTHLLKFIDNLAENPSANSVKELYDFLEHKNLPITDDGHFLAYKSVRSDYKDKYSGTVDNSIGKVIEMARNQVDDDCNRHCSHGYHVGALDYSGPGGWYNSSGDKVVVVKVNPKDAVSVPRDHSYRKLRVCKYEVLADYKAPLERSVYTGTGEQIDNPVTNEIEYYEADDVFEGDVISFNYVDRQGVRSERKNVTVQKVDTDEGFILGMEENAVNVKRFIMDNMSKVQLIVPIDG